MSKSIPNQNMSKTKLFSPCLSRLISFSLLHLSKWLYDSAFCSGQKCWDNCWWPSFPITLIQSNDISHQQCLQNISQFWSLLTTLISTTLVQTSIISHLDHFFLTGYPLLHSHLPNSYSLLEAIFLQCKIGYATPLLKTANDSHNT